MVASEPTASIQVSREFPASESKMTGVREMHLQALQCLTVYYELYLLV